MDNVVLISGHRFTMRRKRSFTGKDDCDHVHTALDENGQTVQCTDCKAHLNPYWVLKRMLEHFRDEREELDRLRKQLEIDRAMLTREKTTRSSDRA